MDWLKKLAGYAPDIATAIATGGTSLAGTAFKIVSQELLGTESGSDDEVVSAIQAATPEQMTAMTRVNNEFILEKLRIENQDLQAEHSTTQETIRNGDNSDSKVVKWTRPAHATASLAFAFWYVETAATVDVAVLSALLALPFAYSGLRQFGKWKTADALVKLNKK